MKGRNVLEFNLATMREALQLYLDSIFVSGKSPRVEDVEETNTAGIFKVITSAEDAELK